MTKDEVFTMALEAMSWIEPCDRTAAIERAITAIKEALAQPEQTNTRPYYTIDELNAWADEKEKQAWRNAAIRVGEELSSVGPDGYYDMNAWQWLDWAMEQQPRGKNYLAQPEQERNFCPRCGKRLGSNDWDVHTCTPPQSEQTPVQFKCTVIDDLNRNGVSLEHWGHAAIGCERADCVQPEQDIPKIGCVNHDCDKCKAQSEQEPVARSKAYDMIDRFLRNNLSDEDYAEYSKALDSIYTTQPPLKPLTDEQIGAIDELMKLNTVMMLPMEYFMRVIRAVEVAHGIKE